MQSLTLRIPPLAVFAVAALGICLSAQTARWFAWPAMIRYPASAVLALLGIAIGASGIAEFRRARTTLHPMHPERASRLVASGVFRYSRNPMYLGMLLVLGAIAVLVGQPLGFLVLPAFVLYLNRFQIVAEEQAIGRHFGPAYLDYRRRVRRWI